MAAAENAGRATRNVADATHDLYRQYGKQIYAYCLHQLRSREEAEDAVQTTFLNAFRGLQRGTTTSFEQAWLYKIAQNVCIARRSSSGRRLKLETPDDFEILQEVVAAEATAVDRDTLELMGLEEALDSMPENQRKAILLREWQGLSYREIAAELDLSQGAVEMLDLPRAPHARARARAAGSRDAEAHEQGEDRLQLRLAHRGDEVAVLDGRRREDGGGGRNDRRGRRDERRALGRKAVHGAEAEGTGSVGRSHDACCDHVGCRERPADAAHAREARADDVALHGTGRVASVRGLRPAPGHPGDGDVGIGRRQLNVDDPLRRTRIGHSARVRSVGFGVDVDRLCHVDRAGSAAQERGAVVGRASCRRVGSGAGLDR